MLVWQLSVEQVWSSIISWVRAACAVAEHKQPAQTVSIKLDLMQAAISSSIGISDVSFAMYAGGAPILRSPITTHVLDTSMGRPAPGMLLQSCFCQRTTSILTPLLRVQPAWQASLASRQTSRGVNAAKTNIPRRDCCYLVSESMYIYLGRAGDGGRSVSLTWQTDSHSLCTAAGVPISLHKECAESCGVWDCVASGQTNQDGRIGDLLAPSDLVLPGVYKYALVPFGTFAWALSRPHHPCML